MNSLRSDYAIRLPNTGPASASTPLAECNPDAQLPPGSTKYEATLAKSVIPRIAKMSDYYIAGSNLFTLRNTRSLVLGNTDGTKVVLKYPQ